MSKPFRRYTKDRSGTKRFRGYYLWFTDARRRPTRKLVSLRTKERSVALERARDLTSKYHRGEYDPWGHPGTPTEQEVRTLKDAFHFVLENRYGRARPNTVKVIEKAHTWLQRHVGGNRDVASVTPYHLRTFLSKYGPSTSHRLHGVLRTFFGDLHRYHLVPVNPMDQVPKPPAPSPRVRFLTDDEEVRLLHATKVTWLRNAIIVGVETGMRSGEIRALRWEDVDLDGGVLHVRSYETHRTKSGRDRVVPITDRLRAHLPTIPRVGPYLVYRDGAPEERVKDSTIIHRMRVTADRANLRDVSMHVLRHTYASRAAQRGMLPT